MEVVNLAGKFSRVGDYWSPKIVGEVNDVHVKLAKLKGEFVWHHHEHEDELFLVVEGRLLTDEVHVVLLEPKGTLNTGNVSSERTVAEPERI
jgi:hypothetical protein